MVGAPMSLWDSSSGPSALALVHPLQIGQRPVLITGCDSGFGFSLAKFLHGKGFIIYAGCLLKVRPEEATEGLS